MRNPTAPDEIPLHPETVIKTRKGARKAKPAAGRSAKAKKPKAETREPEEIRRKDSIPVDPDPGHKGDGIKAIEKPAATDSED